VIHPSAVIDPSAEIGAGVSIGPFSVIGPGVRIGEGTAIGPHVSILEHTTVGAGCEVHAGAVLGDTPQDQAFRSGTETYARIGDRCRIREGVTIHRGTSPGSATVVGDDCFLMAFSHLAHNVRLGRGVIVANGSLLAGHVEVGDRAFISGACLVHQFVQIGRLVMVGGGGGLSKDVPPFCMVRPQVANQIAGLNVVGIRRAGLDAALRQRIKDAYRTLYRSGLTFSAALAALRGREQDEIAREFADFVAGSRRGICPTAREVGEPVDGSV
jgi:UDP-N-acetylglucosamine acyltransferase